MRILTIGVVIVTGGTLAALPFRRRPHPEPAAARAASVADPLDHSLVVAPEEMPSPGQFHPQVPQRAAATPGRDPLLTGVPLRTHQPERRDQLPDIPWDDLRDDGADSHAQPLTYRDYAIETGLPSLIQERFSATVASRPASGRPRPASRRPGTLPGVEANNGSAAPARTGKPVSAPQTAKTFHVAQPSSESIRLPPTEPARGSQAGAAKGTAMTSPESISNEPPSPSARPARPAAIDRELPAKWITSRRPTDESDRPKHWIVQPGSAKEPWFDAPQR